MATKFEEMAVVVSQKEIATDIYDLTIQTKEIAAAAKAGQFISLYCNEQEQQMALCQKSVFQPLHLSHSQHP